MEIPARLNFYISILRTATALPASVGGNVKNALEGDFGGELNAARAASSQERITDADIAGGSQGIRADTAAGAADPIDARDRR